MMSGLKLIIGFIIILWAGFAAFLYFGQESQLYQPRPVDPMNETQLMSTHPGLEVFLVSTPDGQALAGWFLPRKLGRGLAPAIVYFGGNAEDAADFLAQAKMFPEMSIVSVNYRGYGRSTGRPGQKALMDDALAVYDQAVAATGKRAVVMGRSLGSGMAVHVAANREVAGAILVTPYDSLLEVAREHWPFMPVKWLLKDHYDVTADAARATAPLLVLTASLDGVISPERGRAVFDAWKGTDKAYTRVISAGHNDIERFTLYKDAILRFLLDILG
ncbi:MAG: alpha/beta hydrolase [Thermodesulfobacteriota bacterium]